MNLENKFSIPFNGIEDIEKYYDTFKDRGKYIHDVYMAVPTLFDSHIIYSGNSELRFIEKYKSKFNITLTFNSQYYGKLTKEFIDNQFKEKVNDFLYDNNIYGVIISDFYIGKKIRENFPDIKLYTSCNIDQYNLGTIQMWDEILHIDCFNLPREYGRNIEAIKKVKQKGFKTKVLLNEVCKLYCENGLKHRLAQSMNEDYINFMDTASSYDYKLNTLRSCLVIPRWLKYIDNYVDVYKLFGKTYDLEYLSSMFDCYLQQRNDILLRDLMRPGCPSMQRNFKYYDLPVSMLDDELMFCNMENCKSCNKCRKNIEKYDKFFNQSNIIFI